MVTSLPAKAFAVLFAVALMLAGVGVASADTELGHRGKVGNHSLVDSEVSTGANCDFYTPADWWYASTTITVKPPVVIARDRRPNVVDKQRVGWRTRILRYNDGNGLWEEVHRSRISRATASDNVGISFGNTPHRWFYGSSDGTYGVLIDIFWYQPGTTSTIEGRGVHRVDYYRVSAADEAGEYYSNVHKVCG